MTVLLVEIFLFCLFFQKTQGFSTENRFITEIVVKLQPLDFVVSPSTLATFVHVLDPLVRLSGVKESVPKQPDGPPTVLNSSSLPLFYLELMAVRIMLPTSYSTENIHEHDVLILQVRHFQGTGLINGITVTSVLIVTNNKCY